MSWSWWQVIEFWFWFCVILVENIGPRLVLYLPPSPDQLRDESVIGFHSWLGKVDSFYKSEFFHHGVSFSTFTLWCSIVWNIYIYIYVKKGFYCFNWGLSIIDLELIERESSFSLVLGLVRRGAELGLWRHVLCRWRRWAPQAARVNVICLPLWKI